MIKEKSVRNHLTIIRFSILFKFPFQWPGKMKMKFTSGWKLHHTTTTRNRDYNWQNNTWMYEVLPCKKSRGFFRSRGWFLDVHFLLSHMLVRLKTFFFFLSLFYAHEKNSERFSQLSARDVCPAADSKIGF